ncbi:hypothetical protein HPB47_013853 [Ixodes persulcatus]|uniref:Uncharacterized protein n=1 Tax=Ixodes persulcatus TaxID=34615 RepID=A0AC60R177_IXOPE|nr:hypothetical protein HPB47_013853 [Ixodes persulcatus]
MQDGRPIASLELQRPSGDVRSRSTRTDFSPQLEKLDRKQFTLVAWDPPGYGFSRPPERTFPVDFYHRDARVVAQLMKADHSLPGDYETNVQVRQSLGLDTKHARLKSDARANAESVVQRAAQNTKKV